MMGIARIFFAVFFCCVGVLGAVIFWSNETPSENPKVIFLYTSHSPYPELAFKISGIPLSLASLVKFGPHQFSFAHATWNNIEKALSGGKFVIIGAHGLMGAISTDEGALFEPGQVKENTDMKHVYFGSCYFGKRRSDWEQKFPNAKVVGYDEVTYPLVGWRYLVFQSWRDLLRVEQ